MLSYAIVRSLEQYTPPTTEKRFQTLRVMASVAIETVDDLQRFLGLVFAYETDCEHEGKAS